MAVTDSREGETKNALWTNDCTPGFQCDSHGKEPDRNVKPHRAKSPKGPNDPRRRAITRSWINILLILPFMGPPAVKQHGPCIGHFYRIAGL